jgi:hypothetical protein
MELEGSLLHLQQPATCHYSEREKNNHTRENNNTNQITM